MSVPAIDGERSRATTSGAVSVTKGEGAGRQAGPAAASVISSAAADEQVRGAQAAAGAAADGERGEQVRRDVRHRRRLGAALPAQDEPECGEGQERQEHQWTEEGEGGEGGHAVTVRGRRPRSRTAASETR